MKKTILLAAVALILVVIGCSKDSSSSNLGTNCTLSQVLSGGKFLDHIYPHIIETKLMSIKSIIIKPIRFSLRFNLMVMGLVLLD